MIGSIIKFSLYKASTFFHTALSPRSIRDPSHVGLGFYFAAPQNPKVLLLTPVPVVRAPLMLLSHLVHQGLRREPSQASTFSLTYRHRSNTPSSRSYMLEESGEILQLLHTWEYKCDLGPLAKTNTV